MLILIVYFITNELISICSIQPATPPESKLADTSLEKQNDAENVNSVTAYYNINITITDNANNVANANNNTAIPIKRIWKI